MAVRCVLSKLRKTCKPSLSIFLFKDGNTFLFARRGRYAAAVAAANAAANFAAGGNPAIGIAGQHARLHVCRNLFHIQ